jgi:hypothetical protein
MLRLVVGTPGDVVGQHREVIRDDQVVFFISPGATRHAAKLEARCAFVINDFAEPVADCSATATCNSATNPICCASCTFGLRSAR